MERTRRVRAPRVDDPSQETPNKVAWFLTMLLSKAIRRGEQA